MAMVGENLPLLSRHKGSPTVFLTQPSPASLKLLREPPRTRPYGRVARWCLLASAVLLGLYALSALTSSSSTTAGAATFQPPSPASTSSGSSSSWGFVWRRGDRLYEADGSGGERPFRFVSFCVPNLHVVEDPSWHRVDPYEQQDAFKTLADLGTRVARLYPLSLSGWWNGWDVAASHVQGPGRYNEDLFRDFDAMLAMANAYQVRLIVPLIDNYYDYFGGMRDFASYYCSSGNDTDSSCGGGVVDEVTFFTEPSVRRGFKDYIRWLVNRNNSITGVAYRDDPAILGWETANEIAYKKAASDPDYEDGTRRPTSDQVDEWTADVAAFLKSEDPRHLVIDGRYLGNRNVSSRMLEDENVDVISDHYYPKVNPHLPMVRRLEKLAGQTAGHKPFLIGEIGLIMPQYLEQILQAVSGKANVVGALVWSLRTHSASGGYYQHPEPPGRYRAYHYPGTDENEVGFGEKGVFEAVRKFNGLLSGLDPPARTAPEAPSLLASNRSGIAWRGAVGAQTYVLQRRKGGDDQAEGDGEWAVVADGLTDEAFEPVQDLEAASDCSQVYSYRIIAKNEQGSSPPSAALQIPCTAMTDPEAGR